MHGVTSHLSLIYYYFLMAHLQVTVKALTCQAKCPPWDVVTVCLWVQALMGLGFTIWEVVILMSDGFKMEV